MYVYLRGRGRDVGDDQHTEALCARLLIVNYFMLSFQQTKYTVNVYLKPSATAGREPRSGRSASPLGWSTMGASGPAFRWFTTSA